MGGPRSLEHPHALLEAPSLGASDRHHREHREHREPGQLESLGRETKNILLNPGGLPPRGKEVDLAVEALVDL